MNEPSIDATLASSLQSLAQCQLQAQTSRTAALDAGAVGLMGVDAAIAASMGSVPAATGVWIVAFSLVWASFAVIATALLIQGADDIGPMVGEVLARRVYLPDRDLVGDLLDDLAARVTANRRSLEQKEPRLTNGLLLTLMAVLVELVGLIS